MGEIGLKGLKVCGFIYAIIRFKILLMFLKNVLL